MYPHDVYAQQFITFHYPVSSGIADQEYLSLLYAKLPEAITDSEPQLIVYNAGTDIFEKDPLGRMKISAQGIINRDEFVLDVRKRTIFLCHGAFRWIYTGECKHYWPIYCQSCKTKCLLTLRICYTRLVLKYILNYIYACLSCCNFGEKNDRTLLFMAHHRHRALNS